jgi:hypothetical protein
MYVITLYVRRGVVLHHHKEHTGKAGKQHAHADKIRMYVSILSWIKLLKVANLSHT